MELYDDLEGIYRNHESNEKIVLSDDELCYSLGLGAGYFTLFSRAGIGKCIAVVDHILMYTGFISSKATLTVI